MGTRVEARSGEGDAQPERRVLLQLRPRPPAAGLSEPRHSPGRKRGAAPRHGDGARRHARHPVGGAEPWSERSQPLRMSSTARWRSASLCARRSAMWTGYPASISWWRRQLATLSRSLCSCSTISVMSVIPLGSDSSFPRRTLPREVGSEPFPGGLATDGLGRLGAAGDILAPPVEDGSLGLGLRGECPKAIAYLELGLAEPLLERGDEFVTLALEGRGHLEQALLDPLGADVGDLRQPLGEH